MILHIKYATRREVIEPKRNILTETIIRVNELVVFRNGITKHRLNGKIISRKNEFLVLKNLTYIYIYIYMYIAFYIINIKILYSLFVVCIYSIYRGGPKR